MKVLGSHLLVLASIAGNQEAAFNAGEELATLHGTLTFVTGEGVELLEPNGMLDIWFRREPKGKEVPVVSGRWSVEGRKGAQVDFVGFSSDLGRAVSIEPPGPVVVGEAEVALRAVAHQRPTLLVVDAETGEPLKDVTVAYDYNFPYSDGVPPPDHPKGELTFRVPLPDPPPERAEWSSHSYYVGAPGRGWSWIDVDHTYPGEILVPLRQAGSMRVGMAESLSVGTIRFRIDSVHHGRRVLFHRGELRSETVPVGTYAVRAEIPDWPEPIVLLDEIIEVQRGAHARVLLDLPDAGRPSNRTPLPIAGRIQLDAGCDLDSVRVSFSPAGYQIVDPAIGSLQFALAIKPDVGTSIRWRHIGIPGRYIMKVEAAWRPSTDAEETSLQWERALELNELKASEVDCGAVRLLDLAVKDARTGEPIFWVNQLEGSFRRVYQPDLLEGPFRLQGYGERISVRVVKMGYQPATIDVELANGLNTLELPLAPAAALAIQLFDGPRPATLLRENWSSLHVVPVVDPGSIVHLEPLDGETELFSWSGSPSSPLHVGAERSGTYRVHIDPPLGYRAPEPFVVELEVGQTVERKVVLERLWK